MVFIIFFLFLIIEKGSPRLEVWGEKKSSRKYKLYTEGLSEKWFQVPLYPRRSPKYEEN